MSQRDKLLAVIAEDLQQDRDDYRLLERHMEALYGQLLARDCPAIDASNAAIAETVEGLTQRAQRRSKVLGAFGLGATPEAMQRLLGAFAPTRRPTITALWSDVGVLAARCQQLNERNGNLLAMHHEILSQLLGRGAQAAVYAPY
ncbi:flagellar protein FlgN [Stutzerimonas urumqiensis]|uniref:flagellar export chaperone FlgN n=1 Tax=Stutzerimonas urumqiensis TaxID=638269 RepID=UPI003BAB8A71